MIAANDTDMRFLTDMAPDQLRALVAHAGGLLAYQVGEKSAARTLQRIADRLEFPQGIGPDWLANKAVVATSTRDRIIDCVSVETGVTAEDILGSCREKRISKARWMVMYRLRSILNADGMPKHSYPQIGVSLGVDHSSVMHGCRKVREELARQVGEGA